MAKGYSVIDALNKSSKAGIDESPKARFRIKDISIFKIYSNSMNFYPQDGIEEKAGEILSVGLLETLAVKYEPCEKGDYKLISGERRWRALKLLVEKGYKEFELVSCQVRSPQNEHEEKIEIIIANSSRTKSVSVMIREEQELKAELEYMKANKLELRGYDLQSGRLRDVISSMLKVSKTKIAQMEAVSNNLIPEFKEELDKERLTFSAAYALSGMSSDEQREALGKYAETGELTFTDIQNMKDEKAAEAEKAQVEGQLDLDLGQQDTEAAGQQVSDSDTLSEHMNPPEEHQAGDDYQTPHPEGITSICYSCTKYETCNVKTGTCTSCDQYENRAEAYKTDEQRYSEEQDAIDKETAKKLREMEDEAKMNHLPSDAAGQQDGQKVHQIRIAASYFDDVCSGKKSFELRKNDRGYRVGDILEMMEFAEGKNTGRTVRVLVTFMLEEYTGLEDGYCIMATALVNEDGEPFERADIKQICRALRANGDGVIDGDNEVISIEKAVGIVEDGREV